MSEVFDHEFESFRSDYLRKQTLDVDFQNLPKSWMNLSVKHKYSYQFDWLGIPIIQMPSDLILFQEVIWKTRPSLVIETGIARGGSLVFWASMMQLSDIDGKVLGIDIDIRKHTIRALNASKFNGIIEVIEGGSTEPEVISKVKNFAKSFDRVMVVLDSNHTHEHVLSELENYADLVTPGNYLLVLDTNIDDIDKPEDRPWEVGNSPKTAVIEFMNTHPDNFLNDKMLESRSLTTVSPFGFWKRID